MIERVLAQPSQFISYKTSYQTTK